LTGEQKGGVEDDVTFPLTLPLSPTRGEGNKGCHSSPLQVEGHSGMFP
jgi:hypothetical protein